MAKQKLLLIFFILCAIWNSAKAQSYSIESFEGQSVKIQITERTNEKSWYTAKVSCLNDSLFLVDYNAVKEVHILSNMFLEIVYDTRGGSGYQARNTVILSVKNKKMDVAIIANSFGQTFGGDIDGSLYVVKFNITGNDKSDFKLSARIYDRHKSSSQPKKNYVRNEKVTLNFDSVRSIFYSSYENLHRSFNINNSKTQRSNRIRISDTLPIIVLGQDTYYQIKGEWYKKGYNYNLFEEYYR